MPSALSVRDEEPWFHVEGPIFSSTSDLSDDQPRPTSGSFSRTCSSPQLLPQRNIVTHMDFGKRTLYMILDNLIQALLQLDSFLQTTTDQPEDCIVDAYQSTAVKFHSCALALGITASQLPNFASVNTSVESASEHEADIDTDDDFSSSFIYEKSSCIACSSNLEATDNELAFIGELGYNCDRAASPIYPSVPTSSDDYMNSLYLTVPHPEASQATDYHELNTVCDDGISPVQLEVHSLSRKLGGVPHLPRDDWIVGTPALDDYDFQRRIQPLAWVYWKAMDEARAERVRNGTYRRASSPPGSNLETTESLSVPRGVSFVLLGQLQEIWRAVPGIGQLFFASLLRLGVEDPLDEGASRDRLQGLFTSLVHEDDLREALARLIIALEI